MGVRRPEANRGLQEFLDALLYLLLAVFEHRQMLANDLLDLRIEPPSLEPIVSCPTCAKNYHERRAEREALGPQQAEGSSRGMAFLTIASEQGRVEGVGFATDVATATVVDKHSRIEQADYVSLCDEALSNLARIAARGFQAHMKLVDALLPQPAEQGVKALWGVGKTGYGLSPITKQDDIEIRLGNVDAQGREQEHGSKKYGDTSLWECAAMNE